jgi:hypothetical protein
LEQLREKERSEISKILRQFIDDSQRECNTTLNETLKRLERAMQDELTGQIKREKESCERTLASIQEARKLSQQQMTQKAERLRSPLQQLDQLHQRIKALLKAILESGEPSASPVTSPAPRQAVPVGAARGEWADA